MKRCARKLAREHVYGTVFRCNTRKCVMDFTVVEVKERFSVGFDQDGRVALQFSIVQIKFDKSSWDRDFLSIIANDY
jgi:hypothetical protein